MTLPVTTEEFWKGRILDTIARGRDLHTIIYDTDYETWRNIQNETTGVMSRLLNKGMLVLDAGCGYGAMFECMPPGVKYTGIDLSNDLLGIGRIRYPEARFYAMDMTRIPFATKYFDVAVCRSIAGMLKENEQEDTWDEIKTELQRVAKKLVTIEYGDVLGYKEYV